MNALTSDGVDRLAREKHAGSLQDLVSPAQLGDLPAKHLNLLPLLAGQDVFAWPYGCDLPHVFADVSDWMPRSLAMCAIGRPDLNTRRAPRSSNSCEYFLARHLRPFSLHQEKPDIKVSVKPITAHSHVSLL